MENSKDRFAVAPLGKRLWAFILDFLMVFVIYLVLLYTLGSGVLADSFGANKDTADYYDYATSSKIFEYQDESKKTIQVTGSNYYAIQSSAGVSSVSLYPYYYSASEYFFADFCVNDPRIDRSEESKYGREYFYVEILGLPSFETVSGYSAEDIASDESKLFGESAYYRYAVNEEGEADITSSAVLQNKHQAVIDGEDEEGKQALVNELNSYFYGNSDSIFVKANSILMSSSYYASLSQHSRLVNWSIRLICFLPFSFTFFFLIPLFMINGETLGKLINGICLLGKDGYRVKMKSKLIRGAFMFVLSSIYVIAPLSTIYMIFGFFLLAMVDYVIAMSTKNEFHLALEDRLAGTYVIDKKNSLIFDNESEEKNANVVEIEAVDKIEEPSSSEVLDMASIAKAKEEMGISESKKA